ncbi:MAG: OmpP1/FadL family transporter [Bacteroidota bacterium]
MSKKLIVLNTLLLATLMGYATGSVLPFLGHRGGGMAYTFSGQQKNAESLWFNPAAASHPRGVFMVSAGISVSQEYTAYQMAVPSVYQANTINPIQLPWYVYVSSSFHDRFTFGLAVNSYNFSDISWQEENWAGRYIVKQSRIKNTVVQPSVSFSISDQWYVGAGISITASALNYSRALAVRDQNREGHVEIAGNTVQWGINSGIYYQPTDQISFGLSYKSAINLSFNEAEAFFQVPASLGSFFAGENSVSANFYLPALLDLHASAQLSPNWTIALAAGLQIPQNENNTIFNFIHNNTYLQDLYIYREEKMQLSGRLGGEYSAAEFLQLRAGLFFQEGASGTDFFSPEKPDANKLGITGGISLLPLERLTIDISFVYIHSPAVQQQYIPASFIGTYQSAVFSSGIGITYSF